MIVQSNILIIGSSGRNIGKTEFVCRIIEKHSEQNEIYGIKVIPLKKEEEKCHRGSDGCGLCDSLEGEFDIIEEREFDSSKDTSRMLKAGAKKVFLLIADIKFLEKGISSVLKLIPEKAFVVIESNSIRKVIKPGLFIVIKNFINVPVKPSCAEIVEFADKIVTFNNMNWDFDPEKIRIENRYWIIEG